MSKSSRRFFNFLLRFPFSLLDWLPGKEWETFKRLGKSRHVGDLRAILLGTIVVAIVLIYFMLGCEFNWRAFYLPQCKSPFSASEKLITGIVAVAGAIIAWAYQTGGKRLGVVDLVSSEIVTLCRVSTLVEFVPNMIKQYDMIGPTSPNAETAPANEIAGPQTQSIQDRPPALQSGTATATGRFTSQENYFPVFENNNKDLQILEARVLTNITGFYTYMKAVRDTLRNFMDLRSAQPPASIQAQRHALINVIYMVFLAHESARNAIDEMIEYEPTHAESAMIVLFTEMAACRFLLNTFAEDHPDCTDRALANEVKKKRFEMRMEQYKTVVQELCDKVETHKGKKKWEKSQSMVKALRGAYDLYGPKPNTLT